ncbi:hypothetical protein GS982_31640 [Rhodococcus hoagii]|nr:hypothetical protein [Prescottella equi]
MGLLETLLVAFVVLRLCDVIDWSWSLVLLPLWLMLALYVSLAAVAVAAAASGNKRRRSARRCCSLSGGADGPGLGHLPRTQVHADRTPPQGPTRQRNQRVRVRDPRRCR